MQMRTAVEIRTPKIGVMSPVMRWDFSLGKAFHLFISETYVRIAHPHAHSEGENVRLTKELTGTTKPQEHCFCHVF